MPLTAAEKKILLALQKKAKQPAKKPVQKARKPARKPATPSAKLSFDASKYRKKDTAKAAAEKRKLFGGYHATRLSAGNYYRLFGAGALGTRCDIRYPKGDYKCLKEKANGVGMWVPCTSGKSCADPRFV